MLLDPNIASMVVMVVADVAGNSDWEQFSHIAGSQHCMGWDQLFKGRLSKHWGQAQH
jgi:hypothetical protein